MKQTTQGKRPVKFQGRSRALGRASVSSAGVLFCLCLVCLCLAPPAASAGPPQASPHDSVLRGTLPPRWTQVDAREFSWAENRWWLIIQERAVTGTQGEGAARREIHQTRLRILYPPPGGTDRPVDLGILQHVGNLEVALLSPEDPRVEDAGPVVNDPAGPWPNVCGLSLFEGERPLDLNGNGRHELAVKAYATVSDPAASRLLLIEPDSTGWPRLLPAADLVGTVRFDEGTLTDIRWPAPEAAPVLFGEYQPLYRCRFLALLGIRGESGCEFCCMIPIVLKRAGDGLYHPVYDRKSQSMLLERTRGTLVRIRGGQAGPLPSLDQALLARAAAFFYLTGTGAGTRSQIQEDLGPQGSQVQVQLLLRRLDRLFLREPG